ncbi:MAG: FkbM family methyltransferase [Lutibacter sp.]|nr:FkbM family methyltransferase [Lutibacter sp.]
MKKLILKLLPDRIINCISKIRKSQFFDYVQSYSQEGEDMILKEIFRNNNKGFYIDVGSHHPKRFSNTNYFYKNGWHGIYIDAMPGSMKIFNKMRKRDLNLEIAISDTKEILTYYEFKESAVNTFSKALADERINLPQFGYLNSYEISTEKLSDIFDKYLLENMAIDFMSVDVEGFDLKALASNDWNKYRPTVILVEDIGFSVEHCSESEIYVFLKQKGYKIIAKTMNTLIFTEETYNYNIYE